MTNLVIVGLIIAGFSVGNIVQAQNTLRSTIPTNTPRAPRLLFHDGKLIEIKPGETIDNPEFSNDPKHIPLNQLMRLRVGYLPIVPTAPLFVAVSEKMDRELGYNFVIERFLETYKLAEALTNRRIDIAYIDIGPLLLERSKGADIQIIAASALGGVRVVSRGNATATIGSFEDPALGIRHFVQIEGRPLRIASMHRLSPARSGLDGWLRLRVPLEPRQYRLRGVSLTRLWYFAKAGRGKTARVDLLVMPEPLVSRTLAEDPQAAIIMDAQRFMLNQPVSVLAVHTDLIEDDRAIAKDLVALHMRAVDLLTRDPQATINHVRRFADFVTIPDEAAEKLLDPASIRFIANPNSIADSALTLHNNLQKEKLLLNKVNLNQLINTTYFDALNPMQ